MESALELLKIKRRGFFKILQRYRQDPKHFYLERKRTYPARHLPESIEQKIIEELQREKTLIQNPEKPIRFYNYSYVQQQLKEKQDIKVSLPTIISRAKKANLLLGFPRKKPLDGMSP